MKHTRQTNWQSIIIWVVIILAIVAVFAFKLNYFWLFAIAMIACHLGHKSMAKGRHH